jgi:GT2 family glycosyltransferase
MQAPALSIITVTYNNPEALAGTLESLKGLGSKISWEHVVVDSSPERNEAMLAGRRLVHVKQKPAGIYPAMNAGIAAARGEFVWFLNGGDRLKRPESLEAALARLRENGAASMAIAAAELMREGRPLYTQRPRLGILPLLGINRVCHQAVLYRRALFERLGAFAEQYRLAADYELHLRALAAGVKIVAAPETIVQYDMGGQSADYAKVFQDFARIHGDLQAAGKLAHGFLHGAVRRAEWARIRLFKGLGGTKLGPLLRELRWRWKR